MNDLHTPEFVLSQARDGKLEEWVHTFLRSVGNNLPMSDGLKLQERFWIGPVLLPLTQLERCCGPEPVMEYVMEPTGWERRVQAMTAAIAGGWSPPPLIAQFIPGGALSLRDGNHRHEAMRRTGAEAYWCVIWCDSRQGWEDALALLGST